MFGRLIGKLTGREAKINIFSKNLVLWLGCQTEPSGRMERKELKRMDQRFLDEFEIRRLIENWVNWRDSGDFERFATLWHPNGQMIATWSQSSAVEFAARAKTFFEAGSKALHLLGGSSIDVAGTRATAQTKVSIMVRGRVHDVEVDVTCFGRFVDFLEKLDGRWVLRVRTVVYELDQMIPTEPGRRIELDPVLLNEFPEGYRHMAYMQRQAGIAVKADLPGARGPEIEERMAQLRAWLAGEDLPQLAP